MNNYILEFNNIVNRNLYSNICDIDDYTDMMLVESSGTIYNEKWENFLVSVYKKLLNGYRKKGSKFELIVDKSEFEKFGCSFPGGKRFSKIVFDIYDEDGEYAAWYTNTDYGSDKKESWASCSVNRNLLNCGEYTEISKDLFVQTIIHELTHGFNLQNNTTKKSVEDYKLKNKVNNRILKDKDNVDFDKKDLLQLLSNIEYLFDDSEMNARVSELAVFAKNKLKRNFKKSKYVYSFDGLRELINDCDKDVRIKEIVELIEILEKRQDLYNFEQFNENFERILSFQNTKETMEHLSQEIGDKCELMSIIFLAAICDGKYIFDISMYRFARVAENKDEYDKIYDEVIETSKSMLDEFFRRCVKVTNKVMVDYYEENKPSDTEGDIEWKKLKDEMLRRVESYFATFKILVRAGGIIVKRGGKKLIKKAKKSDVVKKIKEFFEIGNE